MQIQCDAFSIILSRVQDHVVKEYERLSRIYDAKRSFDVEATSRETTKRLDLHDDDRLFEVGYGTGMLPDLLSAAHPGRATQLGSRQR
ncbi:MAG: hypothetical protein PF501_05845 [Salinisphaera sp.]|jgi:ubiquinone/menaquinone biosynthesis C-methylase UbiE|nr:hypothetical protein [Salinisphaera sp.]